MDSVSASFSSILGYFDWLDLCDAKFVLGWCDCRKQNSTITIVVINAFCYLKKILLMYAAASIKKIILIKDLIFTKISKILFLFTAVTVSCSPIRNLIIKELSYHRIDRITLDYQISFINDRVYLWPFIS